MKCKGVVKTLATLLAQDEAGKTEETFVLANGKEVGEDDGMQWTKTVLYRIVWYRFGLYGWSGIVELNWCWIDPDERSVNLKWLVWSWCGEEHRDGWCCVVLCGVVLR